MPVLGLPLLLVGLAALPMLAGIYWLRTRYKRQDVSALFLWQSAVQAQGGGRKKSRMQTPLTLFLELFIIALLVLAATVPRVLRAGQTASVVVVLDDSYSMLAKDEDGVSSRDRAIEALRRELSSLPGYTARLVTAGANPRVLDKPLSEWSEVESTLRDWQCKATFTDMSSALALASEIGGPRSRMLALSDHIMPETLRSTSAERGEDDVSENNAGSTESRWGRLRWLAVGRPVNNIAITNAVRSYDPAQGDAILIELINHGDQQASSTLTLSAGTKDTIFANDPAAPVLGEKLDTRSQQRIDLQPGQAKRIWLRPKGVEDRPVVLSLASDALDQDNQAILMPADSTPIGVSVLIDDQALRRATEQAINASGRARLVSQGASLLFTDQLATAEGLPAGSAWVVRFDRGDKTQRQAQAQAFLGPFVIDYDHPLSEGLSLTGLVWSVAPRGSADETPETETRNDRPVIAAGSEVLLSDRALRDGRHEMTWRLWPERSTMLQSAAFPILVWNMIEWRRSDRPGISPRNTRPGVPITITASSSQDEVFVRRIEEGEQSGPAADENNALSALNRRVTFSPELSGTYEVLVGEKRYRLAVNGGSAAESDLRQATDDAFGKWDDPIAIEREYRGLSWLLGLIALGALWAHAFWLGRGTVRAPRGGTR
ncbi:MAG: BatA and WFA domain-containing protein [Planctomycetota bacterium]